MDKETFESLNIEDFQSYCAVTEKEEEISSYKKKCESEESTTYITGALGVVNAGLAGAAFASTGGIGSILFGGATLIMGGLTYSAVKDLRKTSTTIGGLEKELETLKADPGYTRLKKLETTNT